MNTIMVDATALREVLEALNGAPHYIRELQATRGPIFGESNPINLLCQQYNDAVDAYNAGTPSAPTPPGGGEAAVDVPTHEALMTRAIADGWTIIDEDCELSPKIADNYAIIGDCTVSIIGQTGGECVALDHTTLVATGQIGGKCYAYDFAILNATHYVGGECRVFGNAVFNPAEQSASIMADESFMPINSGTT